MGNWRIYRQPKLERATRLMPLSKRRPDADGVSIGFNSYQSNCPLCHYNYQLVITLCFFRLTDSDGVDLSTFRSGPSIGIVEDTLRVGSTCFLWWMYCQTRWQNSLRNCAGAALAVVCIMCCDIGTGLTRLNSKLTSRVTKMNTR